MSRCEKHIGERPLAVVPAFDVLSGPGGLAVIRITGVTAIGNKETIRTKANLAGTLLFGRIKGSGHCSGVAISRRCKLCMCNFWNFGQWPNFVPKNGNFENWPVSRKPLPIE